MANRYGDDPCESGWYRDRGVLDRDGRAGWPPDAVETFDFVIADKGKELQFIGTTLGSVVRGVSIKQ